jgi:hypothetical protein
MRACAHAPVRALERIHSHTSDARRMRVVGVLRIDGGELLLRVQHLHRILPGLGILGALGVLRIMRLLRIALSVCASCPVYAFFAEYVRAMCRLGV